MKSVHNDNIYGQSFNFSAKIYPTQSFERNCTGRHVLIKSKSKFPLYIASIVNIGPWSSPFVS